MRYLRQSTLVTLKIGRFLDSSTLAFETELTLLPSNIRLSKNGGTFAPKNDGSNCGYAEYGFYSCTLNATDTNTLGSLQLGASVTGVLPVDHDYIVVSAAWFDSIFGSERLDVEVNTKTGFYLANDQSNVTIGYLNNLNDKTGLRLSAAGVDDIWDEALNSHTATNTFGLTLWDIIRLLKNKRTVVAGVETCFDDAGSVARWQWTLNDTSPPFTSKTPV